MPLTLELSKPRLCRDERYINLFVSDLPFKLDTLRDVPHCINKSDKIITTDDKSGYDHILLSDNSKKYFGLVYDGWVMCYCSLPFGFKASCYIYHSISQVVQAIYAVGGCQPWAISTIGCTTAPHYFPTPQMSRRARTLPSGAIMLLSNSLLD